METGFCMYEGIQEWAQSYANAKPCIVTQRRHQNGLYDLSKGSFSTIHLFLLQLFFSNKVLIYK